MNWKIGIAILLISIYTFYVDQNASDRVYAKWNKEKLETQTELLEVAEVHAKMILELEVARDKDQIDIDTLRRDNRRLRLPKAPCTGLTNTTSSLPSTTGKELLSNDPQAALNKYTDGVGELMYQSDTVVNNCRVLAQYIQSLKKDK